MDTNKDSFLDAPEWIRFLDLMKDFTSRRHGVAAVTPNGSGDLTSSAIHWMEHRNVPEVPSPLVYRERVYAVMNGGILTCLNAQSGKVIYRARIGAPGPYYAAPVGGNGKVLFASGDGIISVIEVGDELKVVSQVDLGEPIFATPALVGNAMYVRSTNSVWAFGRQ
jgi:outer membrane protein assembly factor BamB